MVPDSEDSLRTALRELADQVGPPRFPTGPLIRRAARRRARFAAVSGCCAVAVAAAAVAVPVALRGPSGPAGPGPSSSPAPAATGQWPAEFICGEPLPSGLPPATGDGLRIAIMSVGRTASGPPAAYWSVEESSTGGSPLTIGPVSADLLVVRAGTIFAAELASQPVIGGEGPFSGLTTLKVPSSQVYRYQPLLIPGTTGSWAAMWQQRQDYRVVIVATVWTERGKSPVPVRLSVTAPL